MSIELGKYNTLEVVKEVAFGMYLDGGEEGEILLPSRYVPQDCKVGDKLNVFIYLDNEERLVATTLTPLVQVGQFACLEVAWINQYGAFLNWGLMKDLFVPFREQKMKMQVGKKYVVHAHLDDESYRIVASAKVDRYLSKEKAGRADDLFGAQQLVVCLVVARRGRYEEDLIDPVLELAEVQRAVVFCGRQTESIVHQRRFPRLVAGIHAADLRNSLMRLIHDDEEIISEIVHQCVGRLAWL